MKKLSLFEHTPQVRYNRDNLIVSISRASLKNPHLRSTYGLKNTFLKKFSPPENLLLTRILMYAILSIQY